MKGIEGTEVMLEDELLTPPDMRAVQLKQPELYQKVLCRHGEDLCQTLLAVTRLAAGSANSRSIWSEPSST
jgi:hypothetical protein